MNITGVQVGNGKFSRDMVGTIVGEYSFLASKLSERRWDRIMDLCRAQEMDPHATVGMERSTSINRRTLYEPSSPIQGDGNGNRALSDSD